MVSFDPLITQKCNGTQIGSLTNQKFIPAIRFGLKLPRRKKGSAELVSANLRLEAVLTNQMQGSTVIISPSTVHIRKLVFWPP